MDSIEIIALVTAVAWASGINLYATIVLLGLLASNEYINLPSQMDLLAEPLVISAAAFMYCAEFIVDKIPGLDSSWDAIHTFIRIPAGAVLAMSAVAGTDPVLEMTAFLLGGTLAAGSHTAKSSTRLIMQSSPEPVSNWTASLGEDMLVVIGIWTALNHPWIFLICLAFFIVLLIWLLPRIIIVLKHSINFIKYLFKDFIVQKKEQP